MNQIFKSNPLHTKCACLLSANKTLDRVQGVTKVVRNQNQNWNQSD